MLHSPAMLRLFNLTSRFMQLELTTLHVAHSCTFTYYGNSRRTSLTMERCACQNLSHACVAAVEHSVLPAVDVNHGTHIVRCAVAQHTVRPERPLHSANKHSPITSFSGGECTLWQEREEWQGWV